MARNDDDGLEAVTTGAMGFVAFGNLPFAVTSEKVKSGLLAGDELGQSVFAESGDGAYRALRT
ncbi:MAG: hypothetical protein GKR90_11685 [Pseudomonadales bacterium]|nr:hypothetical protein [Pseudomonadales bacterium]